MRFHRLLVCLQTGDNVLVVLNFLRKMLHDIVLHTILLTLMIGFQEFQLRDFDVKVHFLFFAAVSGA